MMGYYAQLGNGQKAAGGAIVAAAPATGPAAPFVAAAGALLSLFGGGGDPQKRINAGLEDEFTQTWLVPVKPEVEAARTGQLDADRAAQLIQIGDAKEQDLLSRVVDEKKRSRQTWIQTVWPRPNGPGAIWTEWRSVLQKASQGSLLTQLLPGGGGGTLQSLLPWLLGGLAVYALVKRG